MNLAVEPTVVGRIQDRLAGHPGAQRGTEHGSVQNSTAFPRNRIKTKVNVPKVMDLNKLTTGDFKGVLSIVD